MQTQQIYGWLESISALVCLAIGIGFFVLSGQTFTGDITFVTSDNTDDWVAATAEYASRDAAYIESSWSATSTNFTTPSFVKKTQTIAIATRPANLAPQKFSKTSIFLEQNLTLGSLVADSGGRYVIKIKVSTERNTVAAAELDLNLTQSVFRVQCQGAAGAGAACTAAELLAACKEKYGLYVLGATGVLPDQTSADCTVPMMRRSNCIALRRRHNDAGLDGWWPDFSLSGCEFPFELDKQELVVRRSHMITVRVRASSDPFIAYQRYGKGGAEKFKAEKKDMTKDAVGVLLCALLLVGGSVVMAMTIVKQVLEFQEEGKKQFWQSEDEIQDENNNNENEGATSSGDNADNQQQRQQAPAAPNPELDGIVQRDYRGRRRRRVPMQRPVRDCAAVERAAREDDEEMHDLPPQSPGAVGALHGGLGGVYGDRGD